MVRKKLEDKMEYEKNSYSGLDPLTITPGAIIVNISWYSVFKYTTTDHNPDCIVVYINFIDPDYISTVSEFWRYMLLSLLTCDWTWHYVYIILSCPGFSIIFQGEIFYEYPMIFLDW